MHGRSQVRACAGMDLWQRLELGRKLLDGSSEWEAQPAPLPNLFLRKHLLRTVHVHWTATPTAPHCHVFMFGLVCVALIAKNCVNTMTGSALYRYDMTISDSMYGAAKRYVTRERVEAMLDYEVRCMAQKLLLMTAATCAY